MQYREYPVPAPLDVVVECVWFLRAAGGHDGGDALQRVLPDGCIELIVHLGEAFVAVPDVGAPTRQASSLVVGMLTRPIVLRTPAGVIDTMGVRFRPGGAHAFVAVPLGELADGGVAVEDLWGARGRRLVEQLGAARDDAGRVAIVVRELTARLVRTERDRLVGFVVESLVRSAGRVSVSQVARAVGVTPRHLQRRFQDRVGVGPKVLARILRFQNSLRYRTPATTVEWARVAVECGYADQSHLIREYTVLAGETPASLLDAEGELSSYFTAPQRLEALLGARR